MRVIAVYNSKGGVGKTAAAVNLSYLAAQAGHRTLLWDLDPQGASSFYFRIKPKVKGGGKAILKRKADLEELIKGTDYEGLDLLPADFSYRNLDLLLDEKKRPEKRLARLLEPLADDYDLIFLDCPPSVSLLSETIFHAADLLLLPLIPTTLSMRAFHQLLGFIDKSRPKHLTTLPFFSMVDQRKRLHREIMDGISAEYPGPVAASSIPYLSEIERMGVTRTPVCHEAPASRGARAYGALWGEIEGRLGQAGR